MSVVSSWSSNRSRRRDDGLHRPWCSVCRPCSSTGGKRTRPSRRRRPGTCRRTTLRRCWREPVKRSLLRGAGRQRAAECLVSRKQPRTASTTVNQCVGGGRGRVVRCVVVAVVVRVVRNLSSMDSVSQTPGASHHLPGLRPGSGSVSSQHRGGMRRADTCVVLLRMNSRIISMKITFNSDNR